MNRDYHGDCQECERYDAHVDRGGSFDEYERFDARSAYRDYCTPWNRVSHLGFRLAMPEKSKQDAPRDAPREARGHRGAGCFTSATFARSAYRGRGRPWHRVAHLGFRLVMPEEGK